MQRFEQVPPPPSSNKQVVESRSIAEEEERHGVKGLFKGRAAGRNSLTFQPSRIFFNSVAKTVGRKLPFDYVPRIQLGKRMAEGEGFPPFSRPTDRPTSFSFTPVWNQPRQSPLIRFVSIVFIVSFNFFPKRFLRSCTPPRSRGGGWNDGRGKACK